MQQVLICICKSVVYLISMIFNSNNDVEISIDERNIVKNILLYEWLKHFTSYRMWNYSSNNVTLHSRSLHSSSLQDNIDNNYNASYFGIACCLVSINYFNFITYFNYITYFILNFIFIYVILYLFM
jgi:hypothetical protein